MLVVALFVYLVPLRAAVFRLCVLPSFVPGRSEKEAVQELFEGEAMTDTLFQGGERKRNGR